MIVEIVRMGLAQATPHGMVQAPVKAKYMFSDEGPVEIMVNLGKTAQVMWRAGQGDKMPAIPEDVLKELETVRAKALDPNRDAPSNENRPHLTLVKP